MAKSRSISIPNWNWMEKGFQRELMGPEVKGLMKKALIKTFVNAQEKFLSALPSSEAPYMPFVTGNLHDSIASVVADKGVIVKASYTDPVAVTTSEVTGKQIFVRSGSFPTKVKGRHIIGSQEAVKAVRDLRNSFPRALSSTMLIAVPYAETPQSKGPHQGYMDTLAYRYARAMEEAFRAGETLGLWRWKGGFNMPQKYIDAIISSSAK